MLKRVIGIVAIVALTGSVAWADDFWDKKNFLEWDIREVLKLKSDSPWAQRASVKVGRGSAFNANAVIASDVSARDVTAAGGGGTSFSRVGSSETIPIVISWQSALPFKKAIVKGEVGNRNLVTDQQQQYLELEDEHYLLVIGRLPPDVAKGFESIEGIETKISLDRKGKEKLFVAQVRVDAARGEVYLTFPKTDPVTLADKDAELNVDIEGMRFKKKFKLSDMVIAGKLEL